MWARPFVAPAVLVVAVGWSNIGWTLDFLSTLEQGIAREINLARADPGEYAAFLEEWSKYYNDKEIQRAGQPTIITQEGISAVTEAIRYLRATTALPLLKISAGMSRAAKDHVKELGPAGKLGHKGLSGSWPTDRVNRYGTWNQAVGEAIYYGRDDAREVVMALIIDDGVPSRGHRDHIFDPAFCTVGVACGPHAIYESMCVITFAGGYVERPAAQ